MTRYIRAGYPALRAEDETEKKPNHALSAHA